MICKNCGKRIPDNVSFCGYCGAKQIKMQETISKKTPRKKAVLITVAIVLFLTLATAGYFVFKFVYYDKEKNSLPGENTKNESHDLEVETIYSYENELGPFERYFSDGSADTYYCDIDINIPEITGDVENRDNINAEIYDKHSRVIEIAEMVKEGDYSFIEDNLIALIEVFYVTYEYNNMSAFIVGYNVLESHSGGSPDYDVYYFDNRTGEELDLHEYAEMNGYSLEDIYAEYGYENNDYGAIDISYFEDGSIIFYFDNDGDLVFEESIY